MLEFRKPLESDWPGIASIIRDAFDASVAADWSPDARATFFEEVAPASLAGAFGTAFFGEIALAEGECVGVILMPTPQLMALLFVSPAHQRKGVASALFARAVAKLLDDKVPVSTLALNSTRAAAPFHVSRGFFAISPEFRLGGTVARRMALWLPCYRALHGPKGGPEFAFTPEP